MNETNPQGNLAIWSALGPAATIVVAFIGWWLVERFARQRERRDDLRTLLAVFSESIGRLNRDAVEFYLEDGKSARAKSLSAGIKSKIAALAEQLAILKDGGLAIDTNIELVAVRRIITGGAFDSSLRPPILPDAELMHLIAHACEDLEIKVTAAFYRSIILPSRKRSKHQAEANAR